MLCLSVLKYGELTVKNWLGFFLKMGGEIASVGGGPTFVIIGKLSLKDAEPFEYSQTTNDLIKIVSR